MRYLPKTEHIPNALSLSRIPIAIWLFVSAAVFQNWKWALALLVVGIVTDMLDGSLARRFGWTSDFGGDVLESVCDLFLTGAAILALVVTGHWSWRVLIGILLVSIGLQVIDFFGKKNWWMSHLKQWQHVLHPLWATVVVLFALLQFVVLATNCSLLAVAITSLLIAVGLAFKLERLYLLIKGVPPAIPRHQPQHV